MLNLDIDLDAIEHNLNVIKACAGPGIHQIAAIKANAYGHGAVAVARRLQSAGVHSLATGSLKDAQAMRSAGITLPILLFAATLPEDLSAVCAEGFIPTLTTLEAARRLSADLREPMPVYLKIDVGLGRLGIPISQAPDVLSQIFRLPHLRIEGLYTHAPFSDPVRKAWAQERLQAFDRLVNDLANAGMRFAITQARASAGVLSGLHDHCNAVCVGHALYGLSPLDQTLFSQPPFDQTRLRPAVHELRAPIVQVQDHRQGADLAIAGDFGLQGSRRVAILPAGLADGLGRAGNPELPAQALVNGCRTRILAVSLEHTTIELPIDCEASVGDDVLFIGQQGGDHLGLDDYAAWRGISPLEALMQLSHAPS